MDQVVTREGVNAFDVGREVGFAGCTGGEDDVARVKCACF